MEKSKIDEEENAKSFLYIFWQSNSIKTRFRKLEYF